VTAHAGATTRSARHRDRRPRDPGLRDLAGPASVDSPRTLALLASSAALLAGFLVIETRPKPPLLPLRLSGSRPSPGRTRSAFLLGCQLLRFIFIGHPVHEADAPGTPPDDGVAGVATSLTRARARRRSAADRHRAGQLAHGAPGWPGPMCGILWSDPGPRARAFSGEPRRPLFVLIGGVIFAFHHGSESELRRRGGHDAGIGSGCSHVPAGSAGRSGSLSLHRGSDHSRLLLSRGTRRGRDHRRFRGRSG